MYARRNHASFKKDLIFYYANKELFHCFNWIENSEVILDYGCGWGNSLDLFFLTRDKSKYKIYGVDISAASIELASKRYPEFSFIKISNNQIPQISDRSIEGVFLSHVLHHSREHEAIFKEIHRKLRPAGQFFLSDLTSQNPFLKICRKLFQLMPNILKEKFNDDLIVNGQIPEKLKVNIDETISILRKTGFEIIDVGYGHLFFFLFGWCDKLIPLSKCISVSAIYKKLIAFEKYLLRFTFFRKRAEVFYIKCKKN